MDKTQIYTCKEKQHNKVWKYEITDDDPPTVKYSWGRLGLAGQEQIKTFSTKSAMETAIIKKIANKTSKKGYVLDTEKNVKKDVGLAKKLGTQYKINRMLYVNKRGDSLHFMTEYDPSKYVYVEVLNSWSKEKYRYVLSKDKSYRIDGVAESNRIIEYTDLYECFSNKFVLTVREVLRDLARKVTEVISKFGVVGIRKLSLGDDDDDYELPSDAASEVVVQVGSMVSKQVVSKFAALGTRTLEL